MTKAGRLAVLAGVTGITGLTGIVAGQAQESGGLTATASFGQTLAWDSDDGSRTGIDASFGLTSATRNQSLSFNTGVLLTLDESGEFEVDTPSVALAYARSSRSAGLEISGSWRRTSISSSFAPVEDEDFTGTDLMTDTGTRTNFNASAALTIGRHAPFGLELEVGTSQRLFSDTSDPDLFDRVSNRAAVTALFRVSPTTTLRSGASARVVDTDGLGTDQDSLRLSFGAELQASETLALSASLGLSRTDLTEGGTSITQEGAAVSIEAAQTLKAGSITASLSSDVDVAGRHVEARVSRSYDLPNGSLTLGFGLTWPEEGDVAALANASYTRALTPSTDARFNLSQQIATDENADTIRRTRAAASLTHEVSPVTRLNAGLSLLDVENFGAGEDIRRLSLSMGYSRALTEDWDANARLSWLATDSSEDGRSTDRSVSLGLSRDFVWRP